MGKNKKNKNTETNEQGRKLRNKIHDLLKKINDPKFSYLIKAEIKNMDNDKLTSIIEQLSSPDFTTQGVIDNIIANKEEQPKTQQSGEKIMDSTDSKQKQVTFEEFLTQYPDCQNKTNAQELFEQYQKDASIFEETYRKLQNDPTNNSSENNDKGTATVGDFTANTSDEKTISNEEISVPKWQTEVISKYQEIYGENNVENDVLTSGGIQIEVARHTNNKGIDLTGTAANYSEEDKLEIKPTRDGVAPKDQSFQHFLDHIEVLKYRGFSEIALGKTNEAAFRTKLISAVLQKDMNLAPLEQGLELDLSAETLKDIAPQTQTKLLKKALEYNAKINFGENSPLLDFNNKAIQGLDEAEKYQYLAMLLKNDNTKDQVSNIPPINFYKKDMEGKFETTETTVMLNDENGTFKSYSVSKRIMNPKIHEEDAKVLKPIFDIQERTELTALRQQKIANIRSGKEGKTDSDAHDKLNNLRASNAGGTRTFIDKEGNQKEVRMLNQEQRDINNQKLKELRERAQNSH